MFNFLLLCLIGNIWLSNHLLGKIGLAALLFVWLFCYVWTVRHSLFTLPLAVTGRPYSVIVTYGQSSTVCFCLHICVNDMLCSVIRLLPGHLVNHYENTPI